MTPVAQPTPIKNSGPEVAAAKDWAGDFPGGASAREAFIAGVCWERQRACNSFDALTEANKNLALLLESARHYVVKAGTTGAFELRNRIDAVLAQVRK